MEVPSNEIRDFFLSMTLQENENGMRFCSSGFCLQIFHEKAAKELNELH